MRRDLSDQASRHQRDILGQATGIPDSSCIVQTTIQGAVWPVQNLNGQRLSVFFDDFVKRRLRHGTDVFERWLQIHNRGKAKVAFGDIDATDFTHKIIALTEKNPNWFYVPPLTHNIPKT